MIGVNVTLENGKLAIAVDGHANAGPKGSDIVCAGVSAIMQTAILGLEALAQNYAEHIVFHNSSGVASPLPEPAAPDNCPRPSPEVEATGANVHPQ